MEVGQAQLPTFEHCGEAMVTTSTAMNLEWTTRKKSNFQLAFSRLAISLEPMIEIAFHEFDHQAHARIPMSNLATMLALARALEDRKPPPEQSSAAVEEAAEELGETVVEVSAALVDRRRKKAGPSYGPPRLFDRALDGLYKGVRDRLLGWRGFEHPGLDEVIERGGLLGELLAKARARAKRAAELHARLFGAEGLRFTQLAYHEQAEAMETILGLIDEGQLEASLDDLIGPEFVAALRGCQEDYRDMVADRLGERPEPAQLGELLVELRGAITRYVFAVLGIVRKKDPHSASVAAHALRPVIVVREQLANGRSYGLDDEVELDDEVGLDDEQVESDEGATPDELASDD
jgi:hypothetical protein